MADVDRIMSVTDEALEKILEIRDAEPGDDELGLMIEITGAQGPQFTYDLSFVSVVDRKETDVLERHGDLALMFPQNDKPNLAGATLGMSSDPASPGLAMNNPNSPSPAVGAGVPPPGDLTGELADKVAQVLERQVNPAIASHGGAARLVSVDDPTVYLELMGGCQGCGMAAVTLHQGIERILKEAIPEIAEVVDVTDHASGDNPFYASAKK